MVRKKQDVIIDVVGIGSDVVGRWVALVGGDGVEGGNEKMKR